MVSGSLIPPSPRVTLAEATFHLFLCQIQPTIAIKIAYGNRGRLVEAPGNYRAR